MEGPDGGVKQGAGLDHGVVHREEAWQKVVLNGNESEWMALFLIISNDLESVAEGREGHRRT